jgi:hypothetical protein
LDVAIEAVSQRPAMMRKNPNKIQQCFNAIFTIMTSISYDVPPGWLHPQGSADGMDNLQDEDSDSEVITRCLTMVDRVAASIDLLKILDMMLADLVKLYDTQDWRCKFATVMTISQLGEYIDQMDKIAPLLHFILQAASN